jgi:molybdenum cofactor cytidylyltransferase
LIAGVVLAAGTSSRLGRPKQLLELEDKPLLQHVVDTAAATLDEVVVVLGYEAKRIAAALSLPTNARVIVNEDYERGQSESVKAGLAALSDDVEAAAILLGDQPRVSADVIETTVHAWHDSRAAVLRPRFGEVPGHPVIVARSEWQRWGRLSGDAGARTLISKSGVTYLGLEGPAPADVDEWDDYERVRRG